MFQGIVETYINIFGKNPSPQLNVTLYVEISEEQETADLTDIKYKCT